jgi:hypothetical protein
MHKPSGVLVVAVFYGILSILSLLAGAEILTGTGPMANGGPILSWLTEPGPRLGHRGLPPEGIAVLKSAVGAFYLVLGTLEIALAAGLVKLKERARSLTVVLTTILFMSGMLGLLASFSRRAGPAAISIRLCLLVIEILSIGYLIRPNIRSAFNDVRVQAKSA